MLSLELDSFHVLLQMEQNEPCCILSELFVDALEVVLGLEDFEVAVWLDVLAPDQVPLHVLLQQARHFFLLQLLQILLLPFLYVFVVVSPGSLDDHSCLG